MASGSTKKYIVYGMYSVAAFVIIGIGSSMLGFDAPDVLFKKILSAKKPMTSTEYQIRAERLTVEGDRVAKSYFSASDEESFRVLRQLKGIAADLSNLVTDAKEQGVAGTGELERNVNRWIAAKRYLLD